MRVELEPKHISGGPLLGRFLGLNANIRLGRKGLSDTIKCSTNINKLWPYIIKFSPGLYRIHNTLFFVNYSVTKKEARVFIPGKPFPA
jgi:hypothetical protein